MEGKAIAEEAAIPSPSPVEHAKAATRGGGAKRGRLAPTPPPRQAGVTTKGEATTTEPVASPDRVMEGGFLILDGVSAKVRDPGGIVHPVHSSRT